jgi:hypothetical protein
MVPRLNRLILFGVVVGLCTLPGCSSTPAKPVRIYNAGEKIQVGRLTYSVVDVQIQPTLPSQDGAGDPRVPQHRFYTVQISVSNGGNEDTPIPGLALVDDAGHVYNELPDGSGVPHWLGMVRRVSPGQTEEGDVVFDAPTAHYKLRLTDETDDEQVYSDIPLSFVHEVGTGSAVSPDLPPAPTDLPATKK